MPAAEASAVGVVGSMHRTLQNAKVSARADICDLREASIVASPQTARMEERKNGGANHLQAWREHRGLSQERLAELAGTTGAVISLLEAGERGLSAKWLRKLAPLLETTPGHLLDYSPQVVDADLMEMWRQAPADRRQQIVDITRTLLKGGAKA